MRTIRFTILTAFADLIKPYLQDGILSRACKKSLLQIDFVSLRDFTSNRYKSIDDTPFGGGDGMLVTADVLENALKSVPNYQNKKVIYLSPQGRPWTSKLATEWASSTQDFILISGRYAGIDQRFISRYVDEEISIGDYVLSGGELPAMVVIETTARFIPGVLGDKKSAEVDSFQNGFLESPQFTRPQSWHGEEVPETLTCGNHAKIVDWKNKISILTTLKKRPDLLTAEVSHKVNWTELKKFYQMLSPQELKTLNIEGLRFPHE